MEVSEFQKLIKNLYYLKDKKRGIQGTFIWLIEEVGELANILKEPSINKEKASEEIADICAWITSLANLLEIDLEESLFKKYPNKCRKCGCNPCQCKTI
jgi:NTP pyrophosphatase (non-canonical NTP hydrolase)